LTRGPHAITAVFGGDANNLPSTGGVLTLTVGNGTSVGSLLNPSTHNQMVTFHATVDAGPGNIATGTVTFMDWAPGALATAALGPAVPLAGSNADFSTSGLTVGVHWVTAEYSGDANNPASTSPVFIQTVLKSRTTTGITQSAAYNGTGGAIMEDIIATVTGINGNLPTGTVAYSQQKDVAALPTVLDPAVALVGGVATYALPSVPGVFLITTTYNGDANNLTSTASMIVTTGVTVTGATIVCPAWIGALQGYCSAQASWDNGTTLPVTPSWSVSPSTYASIDSNGVLTAAAPGSDQTVTVSASYTSGGVTKTATQVVTILAATPTAKSISLSPGWNLIGNGNDATLNVAFAFADATNTSTVWKWAPASSKWAFFAPTLAGQPLIDYAAGKGYDVLASISGGEGFWVNAKQAFTIQLPAGSALQAAAFQPAGTKPLVLGWNLISTGLTYTPAGFNTALGSDVTTLWAWDAGSSGWYFYAPSLDRSGGLSSYIAGKSYLDFGANNKTLGPGVGVWVNRP
jgi:hypothetical protein